MRQFNKLVSASNVFRTFIYNKNLQAKNFFALYIQVW